MRKLFRPVRWKKAKAFACFKWRSFRFKLLSQVMGLVALMWFLIRVIPKPSRATYPCQRVAFPLASSFVIHIVGIFTTAVIFQQARKRLHQSRYVLAGLCILIGITCALLTFGINSQQVAGAPFIPLDPPNLPIGTAKGIHPGRVVWVHDPDATNWDGSSDYYWDDVNTDQAAVDRMLSVSLRTLTNELTDEAAWDAIFKYFNLAHNKGNIGYQSGEKITIKPNHVEQRKHNDYDNMPDVCPQFTLALIRQLVNKAGIEPQCITLCDPSRFIADKTYDKCFAEFPQMVFEETTFYNLDNDPGTMGRVSVTPSDTNMIYYSAPTGDAGDGDCDRLATNHVNAAYLINLANLKGHYNTGVTLCGKNLYGSPSDRNPVALHNSLPYVNSDVAQYRAAVDLMGHEHVGGKILLYLIEGLYGTRLHSVPGERWSMPPFNGDFTSSLFVSQDPVAIDSVGLDFLRSEFNDKWNPANGNAIDDYLHEAALANDPPSQTFYDPDGDGTGLNSLGVHEHWNNPINKQYSRNLGNGNGIELVSVRMTDDPAGDFDSNNKVDLLDYSVFSHAWLSIPGDSNWNPKCDIAEPFGVIDISDILVFCENWLIVSNDSE